MLHFQSIVILNLESVNAPFLCDLKQNLPKILRIMNEVHRKKKLKKSRTDVNVNISRFSTRHMDETRPLLYLCIHL